MISAMVKTLCVEQAQKLLSDQILMCYFVLRGLTYKSYNNCGITVKEWVGYSGLKSQSSNYISMAMRFEECCPRSWMVVDE